LKITDWCKRKLGITALEDENKRLKHFLDCHKTYVENRMAELREFTRVDADIGIRGNNTIVLTGVYRKQAFVRFYDVGNGEFERLVHMMNDMKKHALVRTIGTPPSFRGHFEI